MPLLAHLEELRWRILKVLVAITIAFAGCYVVSEWLFDLLTRPLLALSDDDVQIIGTGVTEAFFTQTRTPTITEAPGSA